MQEIVITPHFAHVLAKRFSKEIGSSCKGVDIKIFEKMETDIPTSFCSQLSFHLETSPNPVSATTALLMTSELKQRVEEQMNFFVPSKEILFFLHELALQELSHLLSLDSHLHFLPLVSGKIHEKGIAYVFHFSEGILILLFLDGFFFQALDFPFAPFHHSQEV